MGNFLAFPWIVASMKFTERSQFFFEQCCKIFVIGGPRPSYKRFYKAWGMEKGVMTGDRLRVKRMTQRPQSAPVDDADLIAYQMWNEYTCFACVGIILCVEWEIHYELLWLHCMCLNLVAYDAECTNYVMYADQHTLSNR